MLMLAVWKIVILTAVYIANLYDLHAVAGEADTAKPEPVVSTYVPSKAPYLCQFVFMAFDDRTPLDIKFSRADLKTGRILEIEGPIYAQTNCTNFSSDKALRVLVEDFDYIRQKWSFEDCKKYFYNPDGLSYAEVSSRLQTLWLNIDGKEVPCSWAYETAGFGYGSISFYQPIKQRFSIKCRAGSGLPVKYKKTEATATRPRPEDTQQISPMILIERQT